jgi:hypothetical protein
MNNKKNIKTNINSEIESEIYAVVNMILNLSQKYQDGDLKDIFFQKSIKNCMNELLKISFILKENHIKLSDLLEKMNFTDKYYRAIGIINSVASLNPDNYFTKSNYQNKSGSPNKYGPSIFEIPGVTSQITSSFITIMDALKLEVINSNLIINLFKELLKSLEKFPGLEQITYKIEKIYKSVEKNITKIEKSQKFRDFIVDELYQIYKQFQNKLNLKI